MSRCSQRFKTVVAVPCLLLALVLLYATPARAEIFARIGEIRGGVGGPGDEAFSVWRGWIRVTSLQLGGQMVPGQVPWHVAPPPGAGSLTLTKYTDVSSPGLSAAFATKPKVQRALIDLVWLDDRGTVKKVDGYTLNGVVLSSFTATPPTETLVLDFASMVSGPIKVPPGAASDVTRVSRSRSGGTRTLVKPTP